MNALLCQQVVRRIGVDDAERERQRLDHLVLRWDECHRRAFSKRSERGRAVRLLLRLGTILQDGDVIADTGDCLLVVRVLPCPVLVVRPDSRLQAALATLELGNLHVPVQVTETEILTPADGPAMGVLDRRQIPYCVEQRLFQPTPISGVTWSVSAGGLTITSPAGT